VEAFLPEEERRHRGKAVRNARLAINVSCHFPLIKMNGS
jgi:hypothetical protein